MLIHLSEVMLDGGIVENHGSPRRAPSESVLGCLSHDQDQHTDLQSDWQEFWLGSHVVIVSCLIDVCHAARTKHLNTYGMTDVGQYEV